MKFYERPIVFLLLTGLVVLPITWVGLLIAVGVETATRLALMYVCLFPLPLIYIAHGLRSRVENTIFYARVANVLRAIPGACKRELLAMPGRVWRLVKALGSLGWRALRLLVLVVIPWAFRLAWAVCVVSAVVCCLLIRKLVRRLVPLLTRAARSSAIVLTLATVFLLARARAGMCHTWLTFCYLYLIWLPACQRWIASTCQTLAHVRVRFYVAAENQR